MTDATDVTPAQREAAADRAAELVPAHLDRRQRAPPRQSARGDRPARP